MAIVLQLEWAPQSENDTHNKTNSKNESNISESSSAGGAEETFPCEMPLTNNSSTEIGEKRSGESAGRITDDKRENEPSFANVNNAQRGCESDNKEVMGKETVNGESEGIVLEEPEEAPAEESTLSTFSNKVESKTVQNEGEHNIVDNELREEDEDERYTSEGRATPEETTMGIFSSKVESKTVQNEGEHNIVDNEQREEDKEKGNETKDEKEDEDDRYTSEAPATPEETTMSTFSNKVESKTVQNEGEQNCWQ